MIQQGYLSPVVPKQTTTQLDVGGVGTRGGEFIAKDLEAAVDRDEVTRAAVAEIVEHGAERGSWLVFCSGVAHARHVRDTRLRLHGIDAPELRQTCEDQAGEAWACGRRAASELAAAVAGGEIHCISRERDRYQRLIATCWSQGRDIGQSLVSHGWAVAYRRYSVDYVRNEDIARYLTQGMWAGRFEMPWEWRQARRRQ
jgi:endonuclease YncB( thermonuclease family)